MTMRPKITIVAIDPGNDTGLALIRPDGTIECATMDYRKIVHSLAVNGWWFCAGQVFVVEQYTRRANVQGFAIEIAPRVIGAIELFAEQHGISVVFQSPGDAKAFSTDDKLKPTGWKWSTRHEKDALRHALLYIYKHAGD